MTGGKRVGVATWPQSLRPRWAVTWSAPAALTKLRGLGSLSGRNVIFPSSKVSKLKTKVPVHSVPGVDSGPGSQTVTFSLCAQQPLFTEGAQGEREREPVGVSSYKDTNPI